MGDPDPLVEEMRQARRGRRRIVVAAVIAVVVGALLATAITLGALARTY